MKKLFYVFTKKLSILMLALVSITSLAQDPSINNLSLSFTSSTTGTLTYDVVQANPTDLAVASYAIKVKNGATVLNTETYTPVLVVPGSTPFTYSLTGLTASTAYTFNVVLESTSIVGAVVTEVDNKSVSGTSPAVAPAMTGVPKFNYNSGKTSTSLNLAIKDSVVGETHYDVLFRVKDVGNYVKHNTAPIKLTKDSTYVMGGLTPLTTYQMRFIAVNGTDTLYAANIEQGQTADVITGKPEARWISQPYPDKVEIHLIDGTIGETRHDLLYRKKGTLDWTTRTNVTASSGGNGTLNTVGGLDPLTTYEFILVAVTGSKSINSDISIANTSVPYPVGPATFFLISQCPEGAELGFTFTDPSIISEFRIYDRGKIVANGIPSMSQIHVPLIPGVVHQFSMETINETSFRLGRFGYSGTVQVAAQQYQPPRKPTNFSQPFNVTQTSMEVSWVNGIEEPQCFNYMRDYNEIIAEITNADGTTELRRLEAPKNATTFKVENLKPKSIVKLTLNAVGPASLGSNRRTYVDAPVVDTTLGPPFEPKFFSGWSQNDVFGQKEIVLNWCDCDNDEDGFVVELKNADGSFTELARPKPNSTFFWHKPVQTNVPYTYRVYAFNIYGKSVISPEVTVTVLADTIPNVPVGLIAKLNGDKVDLTWRDDSFSEDLYRIMRSTDAGVTWTKIDSVNRNVTKYTDSNVTDGNTYYYAIIAVNTKGASAPSKMAKVVVGTPPSTSSLVQNSPAALVNSVVRIYPNPSSDVINLNVGEANLKAQVYVIDQGNRKIPLKSIEITNGEGQIDISNLLPGAYQLIIEGESFRNTKKIFKY